MNELKNKKLFLLDMDGTIYIDDLLFDGVLELLDYIKEIGGRYIFLTNNSSKSVDAYIQKLNKMGIECTEKDFLTSTNATIEYLQHKNYNKIYALGTNTFKQQLSDADLTITDRLEEDIDCLCMGFDTELTFQKIEDACILLNRKVDYVATNPDWVCPTKFGFVPDCGSLSMMLDYATKRKPLFIGKPQPEMVNLAMKKTGFAKEQIVVIGDRLYTDIKCGINAGISTILVLSGETTAEDVKRDETKPEYIYKNVKELYQDLIE